MKQTLSTILANINWSIPGLSRPLSPEEVIAKAATMISSGDNWTDEEDEKLRRLMHMVISEMQQNSTRSPAAVMARIEKKRSIDYRWPEFLSQR